MFRVFFSNVLFWLFPTLFLPISFQLSSLSITRVAFSRFVARYIRCHISNFTFSLTVSLLPSSNFFTNSCRIFSNSVPLISLMSCTATVKFSIFFTSVSQLLLFQVSSFLFLVPKFPYRLSSFDIPYIM